METKIGCFRKVVTQEVDGTWETNLVAQDGTVIDPLPFADNKKEAKRNHQEMVERNTSL